MSQGRRITLTEEGEWWIAREEDAGVTSHGRTRTEAIENLDEAVACEQAAIENGDEPLPPDEQAALLEELGIDPEEVRGDPITPPWERTDRDDE
jgi:predicted RNase H-like HicB family nuclease